MNKINIIVASLLMMTNAIAEPFFGADVSMLPEIEKAGGRYFDGGKPGDAITILRDNNCEWFRLRLFVEPTSDVKKNWGATQDLKTAKTLAKRIKAAKGKFLLDLHYSDTWADPGHQTKPKSWESLSFDDLQQKVETYTAAVLGELREGGTFPDMVQVGNEITPGMLWPDGALNVPKDQQPLQWEKFGKLLSAGIRGVRTVEPDRSKLPVMIHIHGGGAKGAPTWFFNQLAKQPVEFDLIGLSCYVSNGESLDVLKQNINQLIDQHHKPVIVAEVSYPWKAAEKKRDSMQWDVTPEGQKQFVTDLKKILAESHQQKALGYFWWYPEAIPAGDLHIWRGGSEALFDNQGQLLPAARQSRTVVPSH